MGVIQNHAIGRTGIQQFNSAGHGAHILQTAANRIAVHADAGADRRRHQGVIHVENAGKLQCDRHAEMLVPAHQKAASALADLDIVGVEIAARANSDA